MKGNRLFFPLWILCSYAIFGTSHGIKSPTVTLSNGKEMPIVGFGTHFRTPTEEEEAVTNAFNVGYRHFDTAYFYHNEENLGKVLKKWFDQGGKREDVFITTKLPPQAVRPSDVEIFLTKSLNNLGLDYVDMYLIHTPFALEKNEECDPLRYNNGSFGIDLSTDHLAIWKAMEQQVLSGRTKSIGISNFNETQILNIWNNAEIKPTNLQVEGNVYLQQEGIRELCKKLNIVVTAYSPLGSNDLTHLRRKRSTQLKVLPSPLRNPVVLKIADKHHKSPAQILLRYCVEIGFVVIPKSGNLKRMKDNIDIFNFKLTTQDLAELKALDHNGVVRKFDFLSFKGVEEHPQFPFTDKIARNL